MNISNILVPIISGGLAGALTSFCLQRLLEAKRIVKLSRNIKIERVIRNNSCSIKVINTGVETIRDAIGYITLEYDVATDILDIRPAFIDCQHRMALKDDRLCWAVAAPDINPHKASIYPGEKQLLDLLKLESNSIEIPSEQGWADNIKKKSRVFLKRKQYRGSLCIVGANILARCFDVSIIVDSPNGLNVYLTPKRLPKLINVLRGHIQSIGNQI